MIRTEGVVAYKPEMDRSPLTATSSYRGCSLGRPSQGCRTVVNKPACLPIQFQFQTASLANGSYSGEITVSDPNALDAPQIVTVIVEMGGGIPNSLKSVRGAQRLLTSASVSSSNFIPTISIKTSTAGSGCRSPPALGQFQLRRYLHRHGDGPERHAPGNYQGSIGFFGLQFRAG